MKCQQENSPTNFKHKQRTKHKSAISDRLNRPKSGRSTHTVACRQQISTLKSRTSREGALCSHTHSLRIANTLNDILITCSYLALYNFMYFCVKQTTRITTRRIHQQHTKTQTSRGLAGHWGAETDTYTAIRSSIRVPYYRRAHS